VTLQVLVEGSLFLDPGEAKSVHVNGPGAFMCVINTQGGKVQSQVSMTADGRFTEVQRVE
jgi:hypothetical protein